MSVTFVACIPTELYLSLPISTFDSRYTYSYFSIIHGIGSQTGVLTFNFEPSFFRILLTNVLFAMHARKLPRLNSEPYRVSSYIHVYFCSLSF
jgi:hypothetical protein